MYPFGYGLSYTSFNYNTITSSAEKIKDTGKFSVAVNVKNTGKVAGKEVVQLYVREENTVLQRPEKELKHFAKVELNPGEEKTVTFDFNYRDFAYYDAKVHDWQVNSGKFTVMVGGASNNLPLSKSVEVQATNIKYPILTRNSLLKDLKSNPRGAAVYQQMMGGLMASFGAGGAGKKMTPEQEIASKKMATMMEVMMKEMPLSKMVSMSGGKFTNEMLDGILKSLTTKLP